MQREELLGFFLAALQAVAPEVTEAQRILLKEVVARMIAEHEVEVAHLT